IVEAARQVFTEYGLAGARTRQIADAAGVVEGVIYRHFTSKEELFEAAILEPLEDLVADMARVTPTFAVVDPRARRVRSEEMHARFLHTMMEVTPLLNVALFADGAAGKKFYRERIEPVVTRSTKAFEEALKAWSHPPMDNRLLFLAVFGMHLAVSLDANLRDADIDVEATSKELTAFIVRGVGRS
ncbi:MAG: helix-turn-helix domain-containing protein, partial [Actinomycetota bacterium]